MAEKIKVGILGATGSVGQRFIELLDDHPWFEVVSLGASERSAGKRYEEAVSGRWKISGDIPRYARKIIVSECRPSEMKDVKLVFSGMDNKFAGPVEEDFRKAGVAVCSNAKNHRMDPDVPLLIPEVNHEHLKAVESQKKKYNCGFIITNPNCSTIGMVLALAPLHKRFGIKKIFVTTMQALSGSGYPGVPSMDILDNVIPYIGSEEGKMETETLKILGSIKEADFIDAEIKISAHCNRVHTKDGHLETVNIELDKKATIEEVKETLMDFNPLEKYSLPSAPNPPVVIREEEDRPQPRLDRDTGKGMAAVVGRIRPCNILDYRMAVLSHNTIRGAAGASILNAELMKALGLI